MITFPTFRTPDSAFDVPVLPGAVQQTPAPNFVWGSGGARLTPEQLLAQQELAREQMQSDFSPVGHWTEGLGRVVNNVMGALDAKRLDKEQRANTERSNGVLQALMGAPDQQTLITAAADPYLDPGARDVATLLLKNSMPKSRNPFEFEQMLEAGGYQPGTPEYQAKVRGMLENKVDPYTTISTPDFFYSGRQTGVANALRGGGDQSISPQPGSVQQPTAGPGVPHMTIDQMGAFGSMFAKWQQREKVPVLVSSAEEMARVPVGTMVISPDGRRGVKK